MRTKNIILYIIICLIIIAGVWVWDAKGFNTELQYSSRYEIFLSIHTEINIQDVKDIADEVLKDSRHLVQKTEIYNNAVTIVSEKMTEEQRDKIVEKFNEKYKDSEVNKDSVSIIYIPLTRISDIIKHFIKYGIIVTLIVLLYFIIRFKNLGWNKVLIKTILVPIIAELLMYSIVAITRIPFGRVTVAISIGLYLTSIFILTCIFENEKNKYIKEKNNED